MGRYSTGAYTTGEVIRIELSYLLRQGFIKRGHSVYGSLSWTNGSNISFASTFTEESRYLRLSYCLESHTGERTNHDYKIQLTTIPSNLGKGEVIYFVCPSTGRRARILYRCYESPIWKCRTSYHYRIYYESQQCSKLDFHNIRYWALEKELERCYKKSKKKIYQGKETRLRKRINFLKDKKEYHDYLRWAILPKALLKGLNSDELRMLQEGG
jgi:hypothetical protein